MTDLRVPSPSAGSSWKQAGNSPGTRKVPEDVQAWEQPQQRPALSSCRHQGNQQGTEEHWRQEELWHILRPCSEAGSNMEPFEVAVLVNFPAPTDGDPQHCHPSSLSAFQGTFLHCCRASPALPILCSSVLVLTPQNKACFLWELVLCEDWAEAGLSANTRPEVEAGHGQEHRGWFCERSSVTPAWHLSCTARARAT